MNTDEQFDLPGHDASDRHLLEQLKRLRPASRLNRDRLIYLAGKASVRAKPLWPWCAASASLAALAATLLMLALPVGGDRSTPGDTQVAATQPAVSQPSDAAAAVLDDRSYWRMSQSNVAGDQPGKVTADSDSPDRAAPSYGQLLKELLNAS